MIREIRTSRCPRGTVPGGRPPEAYPHHHHHRTWCRVSVVNGGHESKPRRTRKRRMAPTDRAMADRGWTGDAGVARRQWANAERLRASQGLPTVPRELLAREA